MGIEKYFPKTKNSYCGEILSGYSSGYTINQNPEKRFDGTVKGIARLMQNPKTTKEDLDYCLKVNSERLGLNTEDLMAKVEECMNVNCEDDDSEVLEIE